MASEDEKEERKEKKEESDDEEKGEGESKKKRRKRKRKRKKAEETKEETNNEDDEAPAETVEDDTPLTVFVEGVPYDATPEKVAECLQTHTKVDRKEIIDLRFPTWQDSGRMRGYGHVVFATKDILEQVLKTANSTKLWMGRRYLSLQRAKPKSDGLHSNGQPTTSEPSKTIIIKNLSYEATEGDILEVMEQFGDVVEGGVRIARNFSTRQSKGFAYIEYEALESAKKAVGRHAKTPNKPLYILKRHCLLDYDGGRIKGSFKTASGKLWSREYKQEKTSA